MQNRIKIPYIPKHYLLLQKIVIQKKYIHIYVVSQRYQITRILKGWFSEETDMQINKLHKSVKGYKRRVKNKKTKSESK